MYNSLENLLCSVRKEPPDSVQEDVDAFLEIRRAFCSLGEEPAEDHAILEEALRRGNRQITEILLRAGISPAGQKDGVGESIFGKLIADDDEENFLLALSYMEDPGRPIMHVTNIEFRMDGAECVGEYSLTASPMALCAFYGRRRLAELLLTMDLFQPWRDEELNFDTDAFGRIAGMQSINYTMWKKAEPDGLSRRSDFVVIPSWSFVVAGGPAEEAVFFLRLEQAAHKANREVSRLICNFAKGPMLDLLWQNKPELMVSIPAEYPLRACNERLLRDFISRGKLPKRPFRLLGDDDACDVNVLSRLELYEEQELFACLDVLDEQGAEPDTEELGHLTEMALGSRSERMIERIAEYRQTEPVDATKLFNLLPIGPGQRKFARAVRDSGLRLKLRLPLEETEIWWAPEFNCADLTALLELTEQEIKHDGRLDWLSKSILLGQTQRGLKLLVSSGLLCSQNMRAAVEFIIENKLHKLYEPVVKLAAQMEGGYRYGL